MSLFSISIRLAIATGVDIPDEEQTAHLQAGVPPAVLYPMHSHVMRACRQRLDRGAPDHTPMHPSVRRHPTGAPAPPLPARVADLTFPFNRRRGGQVQRGLSAAIGTASLLKLGGAADKRFSFLRMRLPRLKDCEMQPDQRMPTWAHHQHAEFNAIVTKLVSTTESLFAEHDLNSKAVLLRNAMDAHIQLQDRAKRFNFFLKVTGLDADWKMLEEERNDLFRQNISVDWPASMNLMNVLFVDTETTGLGKKDQPISLGAILLAVNRETGRLDHEIGSYYGLREPTCEISPESVRVHGLHDTDLRGKDFDYFHISAMFGVAEIVVAHNAAFDRRMLRFLNIPETRWACSCYDIRWPADLPSRKLDALCESIGVERRRPHNSLSDTRAMIAVTQAQRPGGLAYLSDITSRR